ncbi:MAG: tetratricopeptide repeat protein, partial [Bacteroidota bacterium]
MKARSFLTFTTLALTLSMLVFFSSCKKETTTGPAGDPGAAAQKAAQGHDILIPKIALLANSGGSDTTVFNFTNAVTLYNEAITLDPNNADAHFGLALIDFLSLAGDPQVRNLASGQMGDFRPVFLESLLNPSSGTAGIFTQYATALRDRFTGSFNQRINQALGKGTMSAANPPSYYQNILETAMLTKLISAINHLNVTLSNSSYALLITPTMMGGSTTVTYRIDATEINLLRGFLQFLTADISGLVAYNFDYNRSDSAAVHAAWQPASSFLAFRPNGGQRMRDVRTYFTGAATSIQGGLNFLMN